MPLNTHNSLHIFKFIEAWRLNSNETKQIKQATMGTQDNRFFLSDSYVCNNFFWSRKCLAVTVSKTWGCSYSKIKYLKIQYIKEFLSFFTLKNPNRNRAFCKSVFVDFEEVDEGSYQHVERWIIQVYAFTNELWSKFPT